MSEINNILKIFCKSDCETVFIDDNGDGYIDASLYSVQKAMVFYANIKIRLAILKTIEIISQDPMTGCIEDDKKNIISMSDEIFNELTIQL